MLGRDGISLNMATDLFMAGFYLASAINNSKQIRLMSGKYSTDDKKILPLRNNLGLSMYIT